MNILKFFLAKYTAPVDQYFARKQISVMKDTHSRLERLVSETDDVSLLLPPAARNFSSVNTLQVIKGEKFRHFSAKSFVEMYRAERPRGEPNAKEDSKKVLKETAEPAPLAETTNFFQKFLRKLANLPGAVFISSREDYFEYKVVEIVQSGFSRLDTLDRKAKNVRRFLIFNLFMGSATLLVLPNSIFFALDKVDYFRAFCLYIVTSFVIGALISILPLFLADKLKAKDSEQAE